MVKLAVLSSLTFFLAGDYVGAGKQLRTCLAKAPTVLAVWPLEIA